MNIDTGCKDVNGKQIKKGSIIKTQIDGLLPKWYEGEVIYYNGCYGLFLSDGYFEPMCWFMNMEVINTK